MHKKIFTTAIIFTKIKEIMARNGVVLGYVFGSYGKNKANKMSDLDIAVVFGDGINGIEEKKLEEKIQTEIGHVAGIDRIDLVNLRKNDNPVLRYAAIIEGNPIVIKNLALKKYLERIAVRDFEDTRFLRSISYKILKKKVQSYVTA